MLIKTLAEIKAVLPKLVSNLNDESLLPNFDAVEQKYLVGLIGNGLYNYLQEKYDANTLTAAENLLMKHIRLVIASYGFLDELAATHAAITDFGVRTAGNEALPKAVGWEYKELKAFLRDRALDGTEVLLKYLWSKKADLQLWTDSDEYKAFESLLVKTGTEFSELYNLFQPMRTFNALRSTLSDCQYEFIQPAIGEDLLKYLMTKAEPTAQEKKLSWLVKKALAFFTVKRAGEHYNVRFAESGFTIVSEFGGDREGDDSGRSAASLSMLNIKLKACYREAKSYIAKAKNELVNHYKSVDATPDFKTAFDKGPLLSYVDPKDKDNGNGTRKIFVT